MGPVDVLQWVGVASGVLGLLGAAAGFGAMRQRLLRVEKDVSRMDQDLAELRQVATKVAVIEERTKNIDEAVKVAAGKLDTVVAHLLDESRTFARSVMRDAAQRPPMGHG